MGVSEQSFDLWQKSYGGMGVSEIRQLKQLQDENRRLKRIVGEQSLV